MDDEPAPPRPEHVEKLVEAASELGSTSEELEAAAREMAEFESWAEAECAEAEAELAAGELGRPIENVLDELEARLEERIRTAHA